MCVGSCVFLTAFCVYTIVYVICVMHAAACLYTGLLIRIPVLCYVGCFHIVVMSVNTFRVR